MSSEIKNPFQHVKSSASDYDDQAGMLLKLEMRFFRNHKWRGSI